MINDIDIFGFKIGINWFLIALSMIIMAIINVIRAKKFNMKFWYGIIISILVNVFAILGSHLLFKIENPQSTYFGV